MAFAARLSRRNLLGRLEEVGSRSNDASTVASSSRPPSRLGDDEELGIDDDMLRTLTVPHNVDTTEFMYGSGWSDGFPLVAPTPARVQRMLLGTARAPSESLGQCPPLYGEVTVERVATNAVMAGCEPKQLRVVLAATEALLSDAFNLMGVSATTMGATPCVLVNGPCRAEAGLNSGVGALGSGTRANACVGRALKLILQNVGGAVLGGTECATLGSPAKFSLVVAEAEESLASGWVPHAVEEGAQPEESAVTVLAVTALSQLVDFSTRDAYPLCDLFAAHLATMYSIGTPWINEVTLFVCPEHQVRACNGCNGCNGASGAVATRVWCHRPARSAAPTSRPRPAHYRRRARPLLTTAAAPLRPLQTTLVRGGIRSKAQLRTFLNQLATIKMGPAVAPVILSSSPGFKGRALALAVFVIGHVAAVLASVLLLLLPLLGLRDCWPAVVGILFAPYRVAGLQKFADGASIKIVVTGGAAGKFSAFAPGFGVGLPPRPTANLSRAAQSMVEGLPPTLSAVDAEGAHDGAWREGRVLLEPTASLERTALQPAARPKALSSDMGTVALIDISKANGCMLLRQLDKLLKRDYPGLKTRHYSKATFSRPMAPTLRRKICDDGCASAIVALAD